MAGISKERSEFEYDECCRCSHRPEAIVLKRFLESSGGKEETGRRITAEGITFQAAGKNYRP